MIEVVCLGCGEVIRQTGKPEDKGTSHGLCAKDAPIYERWSDLDSAPPFREYLLRVRPSLRPRTF
jgi:hypothetical protein